jgi:hypothetical protein
MKDSGSFPISSVGSALRACLSLLAVSAVATAIPSSAEFSLGPDRTAGRISYAYDVPQNRHHPGETARLFGISSNSISFTYDSLADVSQSQVSGAGSLHKNQKVNLLEYINVDTNPQLAGWQETIATPNFVWSTDADADADDPFYTINGGARQFTGISYSPDKTTLYITFPTDLPVGTEIVLHHAVQYVGAGSFNDDTVPIVLDQYVAAVPEPSSLAVLGLGAAYAVIHRRRNESSPSLDDHPVRFRG